MASGLRIPAPASSPTRGLRQLAARVIRHALMRREVTSVSARCGGPRGDPVQGDPVHSSRFPRVPLSGAVLTAALLMLVPRADAGDGSQPRPGAPVPVGEGTGGPVRSHHGAAVDPGPVVPREALIAEVLAQHPRLARADAAAEASAQQVGVEGAWPGPMVEVGIAPLSLAGSGETGWDVSIRQPLPITGRRSAAEKRAASEAAAELARARGARHALAWQTIEAYERLRVLQHGLAINDHHRAVMLETRNSARALYASGALSRSQVLRVEGGLVKLERDRLAIEAEEAAVRARLNVSRGQPAPASLRVDTSPRDRVAIPAFHALVTDALAHRPELQAEAEALEASRSGVREAQASAWPEPQVMTSYSTMWEHTQHRWMVGVGVDLMALTGRSRAAVSAARARERQQEAGLQEAQVRVREEVAAAHARLTSALRTERLVQGRQTEVAREALEAARVELGAGRGGVSEFLEAEEELRQVELEALEARAEVELQTAALALAVGRIPGVEVER